MIIYKVYILFRRPVDVDGINETAIIMSTSGSTGPSKGNIQVYIFANISIIKTFDVFQIIFLSIFHGFFIFGN